MKTSMSPTGKAGTQKSSLVFWLVCIVVCYQAGYQAYMSYILGQDAPALDPWCNGAHGSEEQCVEAHLFEGWFKAGADLGESPEEVQNMLSIQHPSPPDSPDGAATPATTIAAAEPSATMVPKSILALATVQENTTLVKPSDPTFGLPYSSRATIVPKSILAVETVQENTTLVKPSDDPTFATWSKGLIAVQQKFEERMRSRQAAHAATLHAHVLERHERHVNAAQSTMKEWQHMSTLGENVKALHERFGKRVAERGAHTESATEEFGNLTHWAQDVQALQTHFETEFVPHADHRVDESVTEAAKYDNMTAWSHDLEDLQKRLSARMEAHDKTHRHIEELDARIEAHKKAHHTTPEVTDSHALLDQISSLGKAMCADEMHRLNPKCAQFLGAGAEPPRPSVVYAAHHSRSDGFLPKRSSLDEAEAALSSDLHKLSDKHHDWEKSFMLKVHDAMKESCSDAVHKDAPSCAGFLHDEEVAKKQAWHQRFRSKIVSVGSELCDNPMRRDYAICKKILSDKAQATAASHPEVKPNAVADEDEVRAVFNPVTSSHSRHERIELHWSKVVEHVNPPSSSGFLAAAASTKDATPATVDPAQVSSLRTSAHWSGRIPSVACITMVPKGKAAKAWMHYFIDNFRLQTYEGNHQLVLVYNHDDAQSKELVQKYADGTLILGASAPFKEFPSAASFRYGAWMARSADVVARWDFEAWHHPQRLSMQVRALAFKGRPASLLDHWTMVDKEGANTTEHVVQHGEHWDSSLVGEARWMRTNWYPGEPESTFVFNSAKDIVKLDGTGLEVFDEAARS